MSAYISFYIKEDNQLKVHLVDYDCTSSIFNVFERYANYRNEKTLTTEILLWLEKRVREDEEDARRRMSEYAQQEELLFQCGGNDSVEEKLNALKNLNWNKRNLEEELEEIHYVAHFLQFCAEIMDGFKTITFLFNH